MVDQLIDMGANDIRALTKNPEKAKLPDVVTAITGFLGEPESLPAALTGVQALYLAPYPPSLDATLDLIKEAGVEYIVALSGGAHWQEHTDKIAASGVANTQLGPGEFLENFAMWAEPIKATGTVREPYPSMVQSPVSMDDIARVAAKLLVDQDARHHGQMYELTGPDALTRTQIAEQIGIGIGVEVGFEVCSREDAEAALRPVMGDGATWYLDTMSWGNDMPQQANQLVAELTGTPALSVAQWAADNRELF